MEYPTQAAKPVYDIGRWFEQAWNVFKAHIWEFILLDVVSLVPALVLGGAYVAYNTVTMDRQAPPPTFWYIPTAKQVLVVLAYTVANAAIYIPFLVGANAVALGAVRTGEFDWQRIWTGFAKWPSSFVVGLVPGLLSVLPASMPLLWILFPIWLAILLWQVFAQFSLTEPGEDYRSALRKGIRLIQGNFWWGVLFFLAAMLVSIVGLAACCIGAFFTSAFYQALLATAYNDLTRQMAPVTSPSDGEVAP